MNDSSYIPVFIAGAGPSGAAAALKLNALQIPCVVADRAKFPRDKICGDAISGKASWCLKKIDPDLHREFIKMPWKTKVWGMRAVAPNKKQFDLPFSIKYDPTDAEAPGFVASRLEFDNFLLSKLKKCPHISLWEECKITEVKRSEKGFLVICADGRMIETSLFMDAMGAQSFFSRKYAGIEKNDSHNAGAVRVYYEGVKDFHPDNFIELHFIDTVTPGYFWIFPMPNGRANVGMGMRTDYIRKRKTNLSKTIEEVIREHPSFKERFKDAKALEKPKGFGLPLGSKIPNMSGDHFMLLGDAAHLIDPLTGEGIGNGMTSGVLAAEQAKLCLESGNFNATLMRQYDQAVKRKLGRELQLSYQLQRLFSKPRLVNFLANRIHNNPRFVSLITHMYVDLEERKKLINPVFWMKFLLGLKH